MPPEPYQKAKNTMQAMLTAGSLIMGCSGFVGAAYVGMYRLGDIDRRVTTVESMQATERQASIEMKTDLRWMREILEKMSRQIEELSRAK